MSGYVRGKEPQCPNPDNNPNCAGIVRDRVAKVCARCAQQRIIPVKTLTIVGSETRSESGNTCEIVKNSTVAVKSLAQLIIVCEIDTNEWEVERYTCGKHDTVSVPRTVGNKKDGWSRPNTAPVVTPSFTIKAWLKRKVALIDARAEFNALRAQSLTLRKWAPAKTPKHTGLMLEIDIFDLHAGKLAWGKETGDANYDSKIAIALYTEALETLIARTAGFQFEQILLVTGNDLLNSDNAQNTTTRGTPQSTDVRYQKTFGLVRETIVRGIERLRQIAPVVVPMIPGNHDTLAVWHLGDSLSAYFRNCPNVRIENEPTQRKYHQFGHVMLMLTHGDKGKHPDYPLLMATEQPKMFGATIHREAHIGHRHEERTTEYHGVRVRTLSALCPPDAWHSENTFVGNKRASQAFVWDRHEGIITTAHFTVPDDKKEKAAA